MNEHSTLLPREFEPLTMGVAKNNNAKSSSSVMGAVMLAPFGIFEGYLLALSGIASPPFFRSQMTFSCFAILKFFLGCVGFSLIFQSAYSRMNSTAFETTRQHTIHAVPYWRSSVGCFILGIGMYISGSGPTLIGAQVAMKVSSALYILLGALVGGAVFGLLERPCGLKDSPKGDFRKTSLDGYFGRRYEDVAVPLGIILLAASIGLERVFPHGADAAAYGVASLTLPPIWPALAIGLNQIPIRVIKKTGQGGSTAVMNIVSTLSGGMISPQYQMKSVSGSYQFFFVYVAISVGAWLCCTFTPGYSPPVGYSATASFIGAALTIIGSRFAGGCTCGHGITGMSELSFSSMLGAMCIFAGGILAGCVHTILM